MKRAVGIIVVAGFAACGGKAVLDGGAGGAGAAASGTTTNASSATGTTSTVTGTPAHCVDHADCPNGVCLFDSGLCATACGDSCEPCGAGMICDPCATSSCPTCLDCRAACVLAAPGTCDDHDDCSSGQVCVFSAGTCAPTCDSSGCADPNMVCVGCATASCPCCEDCGSACLPIPN